MNQQDHIIILIMCGNLVIDDAELIYNLTMHVICALICEVASTCLSVSMCGSLKLDGNFNPQTAIWGNANSWGHLNLHFIFTQLIQFSSYIMDAFTCEAASTCVTDLLRKFGPFFLFSVVCTFLHNKTLHEYLHWDRGCMKYQKLRE